LFHYTSQLISRVSIHCSWYANSGLTGPIKVIGNVFHQGFHAGTGTNIDVRIARCSVLKGLHAKEFAVAIDLSDPVGTHGNPIGVPGIGVVQTLRKRDILTKGQQGRTLNSAFVPIDAGISDSDRVSTACAVIELQVDAPLIRQAFEQLGFDFGRESLFLVNCTEYIRLLSSQPELLAVIGVYL